MSSYADKVALASRHIGAEKYKQNKHVHFDHGSYWIVSTKRLHKLGVALERAEERDAYSLWCAGIADDEQMPHGWEPK